MFAGARSPVSVNSPSPAWNAPLRSGPFLSALQAERIYAPDQLPFLPIARTSVPPRSRPRRSFFSVPCFSVPWFIPHWVRSIRSCSLTRQKKIFPKNPSCILLHYPAWTIRLPLARCAHSGYRNHRMQRMSTWTPPLECNPHVISIFTSYWRSPINWAHAPSVHIGFLDYSRRRGHKHVTTLFLRL